MNPEIKAAFGPQILAQALEAFGLDPQPVPRDLKGFESYVFACHRGQESWVLKLYHGSHRRREAIEAELDWMADLSRAGLKVPGVLAALTGSRCVALPGNFTGVVFEALSGSKRSAESLDSAFFERLGAVFAVMHRASQQLNHSKPAGLARPHWYENPLHDFSALPPEDQPILEISQALEATLHVLPRHALNYGLIHGDLHNDNFFFDAQAKEALKALQIFDFDDCEYHWYANDIAIALYYYLAKDQPSKNRQIVRDFLTAVKRGYQRYHVWPEDTEEHLPLFMRWRDLVLYNLMLKIAPGQDKDPRYQAAMARRRQRILDHNPGFD